MADGVESRPVCLSAEEAEAREDSRRRLELAVEAAKVGTWTFDLRTGRTWYSARSKQMYGLPADTEMTTDTTSTTSSW